MLTFELASQVDAAEEVESIVLSPGTKGFVRSVRRSRDGRSLGEPADDRIPAADGARSFSECVRPLTRAGVCDAPRSEQTSGTWVSVDRLGPGGRSIDGWPKRFSPTAASSAQVDAIRGAVELIKKLR